MMNGKYTGMNPIIVVLGIKVYLTVGSFSFVFIGHVASFPYNIVPIYDASTY